MKYKPLYDKVLIKKEEVEEKTASGIIITENLREKPCRGEVVAVGHGRVTAKGDISPLLVEVGDRVSFGKYSGTEEKLGDEVYLVMKEDEIHGVIK